MSNKTVTPEKAEEKGEPMRELWTNLAALIKVKTIVTLVVIGVFAALAMTDKLPADTIMTVVTMVVAFYFGTQNSRHAKG